MYFYAEEGGTPTPYIGATSLTSCPEILNLTLIIHGPSNPKSTVLSRPGRILGLAWPGPVLGRQVWHACF